MFKYILLDISTLYSIFDMFTQLLFSLKLFISLLYKKTLPKREEFLNKSLIFKIVFNNIYYSGSIINLIAVLSSPLISISKNAGVQTRSIPLGAT